MPFVPTSPAYSLISQDYDKLHHVLNTVTPGLVFASRRRALWPRHPGRGGRRRGSGADRTATLPGRATTSFAALLATAPTPAVDAAMHATGPDTIAKFLFTAARPSCPRP